MDVSYNIIYNNEVASYCKYGKSFVWEVLHGYNYDNLFTREVIRPISSKKLEGYKKLAENRLYYQKNPVQFVVDFFHIQLVDSQAYLFHKAWMCPNVLILGSRAYGKSFWISLFGMSKQMLSSEPWNFYIASGSSQQSATTFKKIEDIAKDNISSLVGSTGKIFKDEIEVKAAGDGFSHSSSGHTYNLYNSSFCKTLSSNVDKARGARSDCVIFDEVGFLDSDLIHVYGAFVAVNENFVTGFDEHGNEIDVVRLLAKPKGIPKQKIYVSSASSTDTEFYKLYRDFSKRMLMGDKNYFVAQIDCELVMSPTIHNVPTSPALSRDQVESAMRSNPEKARREYYCEFTTDAGANAIIRRGVIARNEESRKPILYNDTNERKIIITYDPARIKDNSVILVGELYDDGNKNEHDLKVRLINCISLIDLEKKKKTPMTIPNQVRALRDIILDYNQGGDDNYSNIVGVYIDAGSGGQASAICDELMQDWTDKSGKIHKGLIDKEYSADYIKDFPNAINKVHMMTPTGYKSDMYEALIQMMEQNKIKFTSSYDNKGYLTIVDIDYKKLESEKKKIFEKYKNNKKLSVQEVEEKVNEELDNMQLSKTTVEKLNWKDEIALTNIDIVKEQLVNMCRIRRDTGKDGFELVPEKRNRMHDDHAYVCAMMGYALSQERRKNIIKKPKKDVKKISDLLLKQSKISSRKVGIFD